MIFLILCGGKENEEKEDYKCFDCGGGTLDGLFDNNRNTGKRKREKRERKERFSDKPETNSVANPRFYREDSSVQIHVVHTESIHRLRAQEERISDRYCS